MSSITAERKLEYKRRFESAEILDEEFMILTKKIHNWDQLAQSSSEPVIEKFTFGYNDTRILVQIYFSVAEAVRTNDRIEDTAQLIQSLVFHLRDEIAPNDEMDHHAAWLPGYLP